MLAMSRRFPSSRPGPSLEGCAGAVAGFTLTYIGVEAALPGALHPIHWGVTVLGAVSGYLIGQVVYRVKAGNVPVRGHRVGRRK